MKEELELISEIYKRINISELAPRDVIKGHLRDARLMLNNLTVKLSQHDVSGRSEQFICGKQDLSTTAERCLNQCEGCKHRGNQ